jgi:L-serine dehydratase
MSDVPAYPDFFNDVFGPVMQPGSSSHTAAPCRLGNLARDLLGEAPARARIELDSRGSFAGTFGVMAEDRAMVAGVLGFPPDDERLFRSLAFAEESGLVVEFVFVELAGCGHPNAMRFVLSAAGGRTVSLLGTSTGGGMIETTLVDGFPLRTVGDEALLLVFDAAASLTQRQLSSLRALLSSVMADETLEGPGGARLHVFHLAAEPDVEEVRSRLGAERHAGRVALLRPVLPVVRSASRRPQLFGTMARWREVAAERGVSLSEAALHYEMRASGWPRERVLSTMRTLAGLMRRQTRAAYDEGALVPTSPFKPDFASRWAVHQRRGKTLTDPLVAQTVRWAYGAGAGIPGVKCVPGPMGGGGGYVYAALSAVQVARNLDDDDLLRGLLVAAGVAAIAFSRTEPTGEVVGCSGEAGVCGAMAAAGIVELVGGSPAQAEDAASLALQAFTGMPCDPMPGGLCQPCRSRVLAATCMAHVFADLALAGHEAVLPLHEALDVLDAVGRGLPRELLCTSKGGAAATPEGLRRRAEYERWSAASRPEDRPPGNLI